MPSSVSVSNRFAVFRARMVKYQWIRAVRSLKACVGVCRCCSVLSERREVLYGTSPNTVGATHIRARTTPPLQRGLYMHTVCGCLIAESLVVMRRSVSQTAKGKSASDLNFTGARATLHKMILDPTPAGESHC